MPIPKDSLLFGFEEKLTDEQREYITSIFDNRLTITDSISGSGKTTLAVAVAKMMQQPLYYIFAPVQEGSLGFLPGDLEDKTAPYLQPLRDALEAINENPKQVIYKEDIPVTNCWVYPMPHTYLRGGNIMDVTVIIDEAQNFTRAELRKVLTRIHDSCTVILIGHNGQVDLPDPTASGFSYYIEVYKDKPYAHFVRLTKDFRGELARDADQ